MIASITTLPFPLCVRTLPVLTASHLDDPSYGWQNTTSSTLSDIFKRTSISIAVDGDYEYEATNTVPACKPTINVSGSISASFDIYSDKNECFTIDGACGRIEPFFKQFLPTGPDPTNTGTESVTYSPAGCSTNSSWDYVIDNWSYAELYAGRNDKQPIISLTFYGYSAGRWMASTSLDYINWYMSTVDYVVKDPITFMGISLYFAIQNKLNLYPSYTVATDTINMDLVIS